MLIEKAYNYFHLKVKIRYVIWQAHSKVKQINEYHVTSSHLPYLLFTFDRWTPILHESILVFIILLLFSWNINSQGTWSWRTFQS